MIHKKILIISITIFSIIISILTGCKKNQTGVIKLGAILPLTGEIASYGIKAKRGIEIAVKEQNKKGGLLGRKIEVIFNDDKNDKREAVTIMNKLTTIDKVPVIFGSASSTISLALAPIANRNKTILISPISSSQQLSKEGGAFFFRTCPSDDQQAKIISNWVKDSGAKKIAIIYTNNSWGKPLTNKIKEFFTKMGGSVLLEEGVNENSSDFRTIISKIKGIANLDAIVSPTYPKEGAIFVRQLRELGIKAQLFGGDPWESPEFRKRAGNASNGVFYVAPSENTSTEYIEFSNRYKNQYGESTDVFGAYAYDAATAIFLSIKKKGSINPVDIQKGLLEISFKGISGKVSFLQNGDLATDKFSKMTIKNGKEILIKEVIK